MIAHPGHVPADDPVAEPLVVAEVEALLQKGPLHVPVGLGEYSAETVQTVAACMAAGMTIEQVAELQLAFPTFTEAVCMAAQKICRTLGIGNFPQVWSYLGAED